MNVADTPGPSDIHRTVLSPRDFDAVLAWLDEEPEELPALAAAVREAREHPAAVPWTL